jgi:transposase
MAAAFRQRLLDKGKKKMQAVVAIMRKLLTVAWAMVRHPSAYQSQKLYAGA